MSMTVATSPSTRPSLFEYGVVAAVIAAGVSVLVWVTGASTPAAPQEITLPLLGMFALTSVVWLLMVIFRNAAVLFGAASIEYFRDYKTSLPRDWVERPTRAFNNLMQVPALFYVASLLSMQLHTVDRAEISLAWLFLITRTLHSIIFIAFNYVPLRFAFYALSCIVVATMWGRIAFEVLV